MIYIYKLIDQNNKTFYIGQTNNTKRRLYEHQREFNNQKKQLYKKMYMLGITSFNMEIICEEPTKYRGELRETLLICEYLLNDVKILNKSINPKNNHYGKKTKTKKEKITKPN